MQRRRFPIQVFDSLSSTNDSILEAGESDAPEGTTYIARSQSRGRGRAGRAWWSPPGAGLWMSTLLRPSRSSAHWGGVSLLAGAAVRTSLERLGVKGVDLYWPNDLQVGKRKIGGILGEVRSRGEEAWIALGIGINIDLSAPNVRASMPREIEAIATSMTEAGPPRTRIPEEIAMVILEEFWPLYKMFQSGEKLPLLVGSTLAHTGRTVEIRVSGQKSWRGVVEGLHEDGALLVRTLGRESRLAQVTGGEVLYEDSP